MTKKQKYIIKTAFSMVELMISLTILVVVGLMIATTVSKKTEKTLSELTGAEYICYKDNEGQLHQVSTAYYYGGKSTTNEDQVVSNCKFTLPNNASNANIYLIGGGGGGGGLMDITDGSSDAYWIKSTESSTNLKPLDCSASHYYYDSSVGGYADCCTKLKQESGGNTWKCGLVTGFTSGYPYSSSCTNILLNMSTHESDSFTIPTAATKIENKLTSYMDDNTYNSLILANYVVDVKGGGATDSQHFYYTIPNPKVGNQFSCYNGKAATSGSQTGETYISPTPGIIQLNDVVIKKVQGSKWTDISTDAPQGQYKNTNYGSLQTNTSPIPHTFYYSSTILTYSKKLPYGENGTAGETTEILGQNLAGKTINIKAEDIGNGGTGGIISTNATEANGKTGGTTTFVINTTTRTAKGGTGGEAKFNDITRTILKDYNKININKSPTWWERKDQTFNTTYDTKGSISTYTQSILNNNDTTIIDTSTYYAHPYSGSGSNIDYLSSSQAIAESYGAGGPGVNSKIAVDPFYQFVLTKTTGSTTETKINVTHKPTLNNISKNNGNGGAIIIKWGEAIK